jgi:glycosyltransferase involved in cell wall biosynthesis
MSLDVTVAICTWNRHDLLAQTLSALERLVVSPATRWELIVVDNGSTDRTAGLIASWCSSGKLPMRSVFEPTLGLSNARNRAVREARSDWVLFTDDDVILDPDWLEAFVAARGRHPSAGAIGGHVAPWFVEPPDPELFDAFPAVRKGFCGIDLGPVERVLPPEINLVGANFAIRLDRANLRSFNPNLGPKGTNPVGADESEYLMQLRAAALDVIWCPAMRVQHYVDAKRVSLPYLRKFYGNIGRHDVVLHGVPEGTRVAGVPRWLVRRYLQHSLTRAAKTLAGDRVGAMRAMRYQWQLGGMIAQCRAI